MTETESLLNQISSLKKTYSLMRKHSGLEFNIFSVLQIEHYEVSTHSRMIAELLSPKGSHGQGDLYLKLFVNGFVSEHFEFDTASATVEVEKSVGDTTETDGGRLDIILRDHNGNQIVIENKIYAEDQPNQLLRYYNYAIKSGHKFEIIYLTLGGDEVSDKASGGIKTVKESVVRKSYKEDISKWLENCRDKSATKPAIREILTQYLETVNELTGTSIFDEENMAITDEIMKSPENVSAFYKLLESQNSVNLAVQKKLVEQVEMVAKELNLDVSFENGMSEQYATIKFFPKEVDKSIYFLVQFDGKNQNDFHYGLAHKPDQCPSAEVVESLRKSFNSTFGEQKSQQVEHCWVAYTQLHPYRWNNAERSVKICDGTFAKDFRNLLTSATELLKQF